MIPQLKQREVLSSGLEDSAAFGIDEDSSAHIMEILRDTMYSDKVMAVLREYGANAWDAHRMSGKPDLPIKVQLPTALDPTLRIRDYGPGLSHEEVLKVYTQYGSSTKRGDNAAVGMLGIGSKSGFAYSDSFTVTSWNGGKRRTYVAVIDGSNKGLINLMDEADLDADETGLQIELAVKPQDISDFFNKGQRLFQHFSPPIECNVKIKTAEAERSFPGLGEILKDRPSYGETAWTAIMGCVPYPVDIAQLNSADLNQYTGSYGRMLNNFAGRIFLDIGEATVSASRESLKYSDGTKKAVAAKIKDLLDAYRIEAYKDVDKLDSWKRRLRTRFLNDRGLPPPKEMNPVHNWTDSYVKISHKDNTAAKTFKAYHGGGSSRASQTTTLQIRDDARIVIKDDKRSYKGYRFNYQDMVLLMEPGVIVAQVQKELKEIGKVNAFDGCPVVLASTLPWVQTANLPSDDPERLAKRKCKMFQFNPKMIGSTVLSDRWEPVSRTPEDEDVFVILESYRPDTEDTDFQAKYEYVRDIFNTLKIPMPHIYGYKKTKADPVSRSDCKGSHFTRWVDNGAVKAITNGSTGAFLIAYRACDKNSFTSADATTAKLVINQLGIQHPVSQLFAVKLLARDYLNKSSTITGIHWSHLERVWRFVEASGSKIDWFKDPTIVMRNKVLELYPLFKAVHGPELVHGTHSSFWVDYILTVDRDRERSGEEEEDRVA